MEIPPLPVFDVVAVAGFSMFASLVDKSYILVPLMLAVAFPSDPVRASFIGFVAVLFIGVLVKLSRPR